MRAAAVRSELNATWSFIVRTPTDEEVGVFTMYFAEPRTPAEHELEFAETITRLAGITVASERAPQRVARSEDLQRSLCSDSREVIWLTDWVSERVVYVSPSYASIWGRPCLELYEDPRAWNLALHSDDRERAATAYRHEAELGTYDIEYRIIRPDGDERLIRDRAYPIRDATGRVVQVVGISTDITGESTVVGSPFEGETRFRQLAENIGAVFWLTDWIERRVLYVSPKWERIWGQSVECLYGDDRSAWADNIHEEDRARVLASFARDAEAGTYDEDFRVIHPDGTVRWLHERAFPIRDGLGKVVRVAGVAEDITNRKRVEHELQDARDEIDALRRSEVASLTSELLLAEENERRRLAQELHDGMNQLITLALLRIAQLKDSTTGAEHQLASEIERIVAEAGDSTRALSYRLSPPILHDLGFLPALQWLVEDVEESYGLAIELIEPCSPSQLDERIRVLLFRAVRELLVNVAKHAQADKARVVVWETPSALCISVEDDGVAFDERATDKRGIGLRGIRERLAHLGGEMQIQSGRREGTIITVVAPLSPTP